MSQQNPILVTLILLGVTLAGCASGGDETATASSAASQPVEFGDDTGAIRGIVTDDEFVPLAGAQAAIVAGPDARETISDAQGFFGFSNVEPGTHRVAVVRLGYESTLVNVEVAPGRESFVEIVLTVLPIAEPWVESVTHNGQYGIGVAFGLSTLCYGCNDAEHAWFFFDGFPEDWAGMIVEARWDTADSMAFDLLARSAVCGESGSSSCIWYRTRGESPLHYYVEPCGDYRGAPTYGSSPMPCGEEEFGRHDGTGGSAARLETWFVGLYEEEAHNLDPVCTVLYAAGCYGFGVAPETRWETWVSKFHMEAPANPETFTMFADG